MDIGVSQLKADVLVDFGAEEQAEYFDYIFDNFLILVRFPESGPLMPMVKAVFDPCDRV